MKEARLTLPQLSLIAGTRVVLGWGVGLLLSDRMNDRERKMAGWTLFLAGVISTIPLGRMVLSRRFKKEKFPELKTKKVKSLQCRR